MIKIGSFQNLYVALPCAPRSLSRDELRRPERLPEFLNCHSCMNWTSGPWPWRHGWRWTGLGLPGLAPSILESISSFSKAFSQRSKRSMLEVTRHQENAPKAHDLAKCDSARWIQMACQVLLGFVRYCYVLLHCHVANIQYANSEGSTSRNKAFSSADIITTN